MTRRLCLVLAALLLVLLLAGCARTKAPEPTPAPTPESTAEPTPTPTPEPTPEPTPDGSAVDRIGALIDSGSYYEAFRALVKLEEEYRDNESALKLCETQFERLDQLLREQEPETGTELSRTFTVQGGGVLEIDAFPRSPSMCARARRAGPICPPGPTAWPTRWATAGSGTRPASVNTARSGSFPIRLSSTFICRASGQATAISRSRFEHRCLNV